MTPADWHTHAALGRAELAAFTAECSTLPDAVTIANVFDDVERRLAALRRLDDAREIEALAEQLAQRQAMRITLERGIFP
jgi:hypothetical protein